MIGIGVGLPFGRPHRDSKIYGASWDKGELSTLTRTDAAVGMVANAGIDSQTVVNDFDSTPLYGAIREVTDSLGNVFIRIPKLYIKKTDVANSKTWQVSLTKRPGFYLPWCFWDFTNSVELPYIDVGKYKASLSAQNKLESKSDVFPLRKKNIVEFRGYAQANGAGYQLMDIHVVDVLQTLFYIEFATLDSQAVMQGYTTGQYTATHLATVAESGTNRFVLANNFADLYRVGQYISIGTSQGGDQICTDRQIISIEEYDADNSAISFDGDPVDIAIGNCLYNSAWKNGFSENIAASSGTLTANNGKFPCVYRGIENPFGNIWQFVDGANINDNQAWVCKDSRQYASNVFASPYEQLSYVNHNGAGYITAMGLDTERPFMELPIAVSASYVGYKDYYYQAAGQRIAHFGGYGRSRSSAGLSDWHLSNSSSDANLYIGGRLLKKPL